MMLIGLLKVNASINVVMYTFNGIQTNFWVVRNISYRKLYTRDIFLRYTKFILRLLIKYLKIFMYNEVYFFLKEII